MFEIANYYICWTPMEFRALTFSLFFTLTAAGLSLFPYFWYWQQLAHRLLLQKKRKRENFIPWAKKTDRKTLCEQPHSSHRQLSYCVHVGLLTCNTPPLAWESDEELEYLGHPWTLRTKVVGIKYYDSSPTSDTKNLENWLSHFNTLSHISFSKSQSSINIFTSWTVPSFQACRDLHETRKSFHFLNTSAQRVPYLVKSCHWSSSCFYGV